MRTRTVPEDGSEDVMDFPAELAAPPIVTLVTSSRLASKLTSNCTPETSVSDDRLTVTEMPVSPGSPEPLPMSRLAPP